MKLTIKAFTFLLTFTTVFASLAKDYRVAVLYWSATIPGQLAMRKGLESEVESINKAARETGAPGVILETRVAGDGDSGIEKQIEQMKEAIASRPDVIIVQPADNAALAEPLREANKAAIPVVAYDQYISGGKLAAYRTSDNYQAGFLDGEFIASKFSTNAEIRLVLVEYAHVSSTVERVNGFLEALGEYKRRYKILKSYSAVDPISGRKVAEQFLRDFPGTNSVDVIFTVNDGGGVPIVELLAAAGRTEILVATVDGDPTSVKNIQEGRLTVVDTAQFCGPLGAEAMAAAYALAMGKKPERQALVPVFPITSNTLSLYPGWQGPIPKVLDKPWPSHSPQWEGRLRSMTP